MKTNDKGELLTIYATDIKEGYLLELDATPELPSNDGIFSVVGATERALLVRFWNSKAGLTNWFVAWIPKKGLLNEFGGKDFYYSEGVEGNYGKTTLVHKLQLATWVGATVRVDDWNNVGAAFLPFPKATAPVFAPAHLIEDVPTQTAIEVVPESRSRWGVSLWRVGSREKVGITETLYMGCKSGDEREVAIKVWQDASGYIWSVKVKTVWIGDSLEQAQEGKGGADFRNMEEAIKAYSWRPIGYTAIALAEVNSYINRDSEREEEEVVGRLVVDAYTCLV